MPNAKAVESPPPIGGVVVKRAPKRTKSPSASDVLVAGVLEDLLHAVVSLSESEAVDGQALYSAVRAEFEKLWHGAE